MVQNLAELFYQKSALHPDRIALIWADKEVWTYHKMTHTAQQIQAGLKSRGISKGDRVLMLAPLSPLLYSALIALFAIGAVPVFSDAGMNKKTILQIIKLQNPKAIFSIHAVLRLHWFFPAIWKKQKYSLDSEGLGYCSLTHFLSLGPDKTTTNLSDNDPCLVTYTTGSTGFPKGADRCFKVLHNQHLLSQKYWPEIEGEVDMPSFPMITLQNLGCGITTVLPDIDFRNPCLVDPVRILKQIEKYKVTRMSGSPAYLLKILRYLKTQNRTLPQIRSMIAGGAPISRELCELAQSQLPNSENFIVYGSTEVEPIAFASMQATLNFNGPGYFVGKPLTELTLKLIEPSKLDLQKFSFEGPQSCQPSQGKNQRLPAFGEVIIKGPHVVQRYFDNEQANRETKLKDHEGHIWHRTGDLAYQTEDGSFVLVGRIKDAVIIDGELQPIYQIEKEIEEIPGIARAALVKVANQQDPRLFLELKKENSALDPKTEWRIQSICESWKLRKPQLSIQSQLPVDHRHNWKINREVLASRS